MIFEIKLKKYIHTQYFIFNSCNDNNDFGNDSVNNDTEVYDKDQDGNEVDHGNYDDDSDHDKHVGDDDGDDNYNHKTPITYTCTLRIS